MIADINNFIVYKLWKFYLSLKSIYRLDFVCEYTLGCGCYEVIQWAGDYISIYVFRERYLTNGNLRYTEWKMNNY